MTMGSLIPFNIKFHWKCVLGLFIMNLSLTYLVTATPQRVCDSHIDLVFLVDESTSISENDPLDKPDQSWGIVKTFLENVVDSFQIGPQDARVALIKFASQAVVVWNLDRYSTSTEVKQAIRGLQHNGGNTNIAGALEAARHEISKPTPHYRQNIRTVIVILTDGLSTIRKNDVFDEATHIHGDGAEIFVVAIGKYIDEREIRAMVDDFSRNIVHVDDFDALPYIQNLLVNRVCLLPEPSIGPPTKPEDCTQKTDFAFVVDNSGSILPGNYQILKKFLILFTRQLNITRHRFAMVRFSQGAIIEFRLGEYQNRDDLENAIFHSSFTGHYTNTAAGIRAARNEIFSGNRGDRPGVRDVVILIADGQSNIDPDNTIPEARKAKQAGIEFFVIGITNDINIDELHAIASDPVDDHFFDATKVQYLQPLIRRILPFVC